MPSSGVTDTIFEHKVEEHAIGEKNGCHDLAWLEGQSVSSKFGSIKVDNPKHTW